MRKIKNILFLLYDAFCHFPFFKKKSHYDLVIVRSDAIGDFIIFINTLNYILKKNSDKRNLLICTSTNSCIARALNLSCDILEFDKGRFESSLKYHFCFANILKGIKADLLLNPTVVHHLSDDLISCAIDAKRRVGTKVEKRGFINKILDVPYTNLVKIPMKGMFSEIKAMEYFIRKSIDSSYDYALSDLSPIYDSYSSQIKGKYCIIALSASIKGRIWPLSHVLDVVNAIPLGYFIVLTGHGEDDIKGAEYLLKRAENTNRIVNLVNKTSLIDLIRIISRSSFLLGNDSSAVHMAAACRIPSICYVPGAHYGRFIPYPVLKKGNEYIPHVIYYKMDCFGCNYHCKYVNPMERVLPCVEKISSDQVLNELVKLLGEIK